MKIRQGFVSNSSSSSFLIIGKELFIKDISSKIIKNKKIIVIGDFLNDGIDVFKIKTIEELAFLKSMFEKSDNAFKFFDVFVYAESDDGYGEIDISNLPKNGKLTYHTGYKDYSSCANLEMMRQKYDEYGEFTAGMQKYLRAKKINKIDKSQYE